MRFGFRERPPDERFQSRKSFSLYLLRLFVRRFRNILRYFPRDRLIIHVHASTRFQQNRRRLKPDQNMSCFGALPSDASSSQHSGFSYLLYYYSISDSLHIYNPLLLKKHGMSAFSLVSADPQNSGFANSCITNKKEALETPP